MGKILCATRGGEASYRAQDAAIALAKERGDTLLFLYVVDLHFLDKTSGAAVVDVEKDIVSTHIQVYADNEIGWYDRSELERIT